jgi:hypothetical protein
MEIEMNDENLHFRKLVESLKLLVLPAEKQAELFEPYVDFSFEVFDSYQNAFLLMPPLIEQGRFSFVQVANMIRLSNFIHIIFSADGDGEIHSLNRSNDVLRATVRSLASELLDSFGEPSEPVDIAFL